MAPSPPDGRPPGFILIIRGIRQFVGARYFRADRLGVAKALEARRIFRKLVMAEIARLHPRSDHQEIEFEFAGPTPGQETVTAREKHVGVASSKGARRGNPGKTRTNDQHALSTAPTASVADEAAAPCRSLADSGFRGGASCNISVISRLRPGPLVHHTTRASSYEPPSLRQETRSRTCCATPAVRAGSRHAWPRAPQLSWSPLPHEARQ
jgi:hypothetical protein